MEYYSKRAVQVARKKYNTRSLDAKWKVILPNLCKEAVKISDEIGYAEKHFPSKLHH